MRFDPDRCPECGEEVLGTVERMMGVSILQVYGEDYVDGKQGYEYEGTTINWDDEQKTVLDEEGRVLLVCDKSHE